MPDPPTGQASDDRRRRPSAPRRARRFAAGLGAIVLIGAAAYVSFLRPGPPTASPASAGVGDAIGQTAPDFVGPGDRAPLLVGLDGQPIRLDEFAGKPLWIVFWATWCTPCQQEASDIRAAYHAHLGEDLAVLAIDIQEPAAAVREYALEHDLDYTIGLDPSAAVRALYGGWGLPSHFFLDRAGVIRDRYLGQLTGVLMEEHLRAIVGP